MIKYLHGNILNSSMQVLVDPVNTVGIMGKGLALDFKKKWPDMFIAYQKICRNHSLQVGKLYLWRGPDKQILLFPTKQHWKDPSIPEYIQLGLMKFLDNYNRLFIKSIAFPCLGCGCGGLNWEHDIKPLMERYLKPLPIQIEIYV